MISVKTGLVLGVILVGLCSTMTACAWHTQMRAHIQTAQAAAPSSTTNGTTSTRDLVPVSADATSEPKEVPQSHETPATTERPSNKADDPRAVIDWLLNQRR